MAAITELVLTFSKKLSDNALRANRKPKLLMLVLIMLGKCRFTCNIIVLFIVIKSLDCQFSYTFFLKKKHLHNFQLTVLMAFTCLWTPAL